MIYLDGKKMREIVIWDEFFNTKENLKGSPYFMLNKDLKQNNIQIAKNNLKEFMSSIHIYSRSLYLIYLFNIAFI